MASGSQVGSYIFGGLFVGVWLYMALFGIPGEDFEAGAWSMWGFIGLVLAGAIYGSRLAEGGIRIALFVIIGIAVGMALTALVMQEIPEGLALLLTFVGAGLIVSALPRPTQAPEDFAHPDSRT